MRKINERKGREKLSSQERWQEGGLSEISPSISKYIHTLIIQMHVSIIIIYFL